MKKILFASLFLIFVGCTGGYLAVNSKNTDRIIVEGKTIKSDITRNFGIPSKKFKSSEGLEVWEYIRDGKKFIITFEGNVVKRHIVY